MTNKILSVVTINTTNRSQIIIDAEFAQNSLSRNTILSIISLAAL